VTTTKKKAGRAPVKSQALTDSDQEVVEKLAAQTSSNGNGRAKPTPKPGEKGFDWQADYPDEQVFVYTTPADQVDTTGANLGRITVGLAAISEKRQPSVGFLRRVRMKPEFDQVLDMIEIVASDNALELIDRWRPTDLQALFEEWSEWSNTSAGES
jgi:hypothetical protein